MSDIWPKVIGGALSTGIMAVIFYAFRNMPALRVQAPEDAAERLPELRKEFGKWTALAVVLYLLLALLTGLLFFESLRWFNDLVHEGRGQGEFYFRIATFVWAIPSLFLALAAGYIPCDLVMRWLLGSRYQDFMLYGKLSEGYDSAKVGKVLAVCVLVVVAVVLPFGFDYYTRIDESGMDINSLFSLGTQHRDFSEVAELRKVVSFKAPNGNIVRNQYYEIEFDDGKTWSFRNNIFEGGTKREEAVFVYLRDRTGLAIVLLDPYPLGATSITAPASDRSRGN